NSNSFSFPTLHFVFLFSSPFSFSYQVCSQQTKASPPGHLGAVVVACSWLASELCPRSKSDEKNNKVTTGYESEQTEKLLDRKWHKTTKQKNGGGINERATQER